MDYLQHSKIPNDCRQELPVQITNSFPPKGIVAEVLNNTPNMKVGSLYRYGNCNTLPLAHRHSCWLSRKAKHIETKVQESNVANAFSPPPTVTEIKSLTRKTPRFYKVDSSILRHENVDILPAINKLIASTELTGIREVYQRVCKGNIASLNSLMPKDKISQKFAFMETCSPLRMDIKAKSKRRVLVPCPYFYNEGKSSRHSTLTTECPSPHLLYSKTKDSRQYESEDKKPIEPTVINLNNKLPELPRNERLQARFQTKSILGVKKHRGNGTVAVFADTTATPLATSQTYKKTTENSEELPQVKNKHILYGETATRNNRSVAEKTVE